MSKIVILTDSRPCKCYKEQTHESKDWEKLLYMMDTTTITLFDNILKESWATIQIRQKERRHESAYSNEVPCRCSSHLLQNTTITC